MDTSELINSQWDFLQQLLLPQTPTSVEDISVLPISHPKNAGDTLGIFFFSHILYLIHQEILLNLAFKYSWTSTSAKVTGIRFISFLQITRKLAKLCKTIISRHWKLGSTGLWFLRGEKQMRWDYNWQWLLPGDICPDHRARREIPSGAWPSCWFEETDGSSER